MEINTIKIGNPNVYSGPKKGVQSDRPTSGFHTVLILSFCRSLIAQFPQNNWDFLDNFYRIMKDLIVLGE